MDATLNTLIQMDKAGQRLVFGNGAVRVVETGARELITSGSGTSPLGTMSTDPALVALNVLEDRVAHFHRTRLVISGLAVPITYNGASGVQGSQLLYTVPRGLINVYGATSNLTLTGDGTNISATAALVSSIGSVAAAADATLTSTEANLIASTSSTLTASAGVMRGKSGVTPVQFDNTTTTNATQLPFYLNFAGVQACATANGVLTVSGTIEIVWLNLGDM